MSRMMRPAAVAEALGIGVDAARRRMASGAIRSGRDARGFFTTQKEIDRFLEELPDTTERAERKPLKLVRSSKDVAGWY